MKIFTPRFLITLFLAIIASSAVGEFIGGGLGEIAAKNHIAEKREDTIRKSLLETVSEINKTLPKMVEKDVRFDSMTTANKTLSYNYTLLPRCCRYT